MGRMTFVAEGGQVDFSMLAIAVDDDPMTLSLIEKIALESEFRVITFTTPEDALPYITENEIDIIITDYRMTQMDGIEFIREIRRTKKDIPIVMVTVFDDASLMMDALKAGATEFVPKPVNPVEFLARLKNLAQLRKAQLQIRDGAKLFESEIRREIERITTREQEAILLLGHLLERGESVDGAHGLRVARYSRAIAKSAGADKETQEKIYYASFFHDIGKGAISDELLLKNTPLSPEEMEKMREHALMGSSILDQARNEFIKEGGLVALAHHEHFDGSGYPRGLKADQIPYSGRVVAIADVFDSMTSRKTYREAWNFDSAVDYIREKSGSQFDPFLVGAFLHSMDEVREIYLFRSRQLR
jgi:response regulator RpfG family c-di-GMP phosphodiesterase